MKKQFIIAFLCMSFLLGFLLPHASSTNDPFEVVSVERTVHITYHKIFRVTDQFIFTNTGKDPLSSLIISVPYQFSENIASFEVFGKESNSLSFQQLPYDGSNFLKWRIYLDSPIFGGDTVWIQNNFTLFGISTDYGNTAVDGSKGHVNFNFVKYPSSPYNIQNCSVLFTCDPKVTVYNPDDSTYSSNLVLVSNEAIPKNNITTFNSRYNLTDAASAYSYVLSAVKLLYLKREIRVDLWGYMHITEEHFIENIGPYGNFRITSWSFAVPSGAEGVYVFDKFGKLAFSSPDEDPETIYINFDSTRYTLQRGENTVYWVTYRIPLFGYSLRTGDKLKLNFNIFFGEIAGLVENFDVTLILPKDASLNYVLPAVDSVTTRDNNLILTFNETNVTPFNSMEVQIEFDFTQSYFHILVRPLIFLIILGAVCTSYVITKRVLPSKEHLFKRATVVPTPILLEFCSLFEEKVSLVTEIEKMDEDLKRRRLKKRIYRSQRKTADRKILELNKDIEELKVHLKNAGGRFAQIVNELEINEAERESAKDGLFNLEQRYLRKKISVVAYRKLSKDLTNRHKKSKTRIDKLLFELLEILT